MADGSTRSFDFKTSLSFFDSLPDHPLRQKLEIVNTDSSLDFYLVFRQEE